MKTLWMKLCSLWGFDALMLDDRSVFVFVLSCRDSLAGRRSRASHFCLATACESGLEGQERDAFGGEVLTLTISRSASSPLSSGGLCTARRARFMGLHGDSRSEQGACLLWPRAGRSMASGLQAAKRKRNFPFPLSPSRLFVFKIIIEGSHQGIIIIKRSPSRNHHQGIITKRSSSRDHHQEIIIKGSPSRNHHQGIIIIKKSSPRDHHQGIIIKESSSRDHHQEIKGLIE